MITSLQLWRNWTHHTKPKDGEYAAPMWKSATNHAIIRSHISQIFRITFHNELQNTLSPSQIQTKMHAPHFSIKCNLLYVAFNHIQSELQKRPSHLEYSPPPLQAPSLLSFIRPSRGFSNPCISFIWILRWLDSWANSLDRVVQ